MTKRAVLVCAWLTASLAATTGALRAQGTTPTGDTGFNDVIFSPNSGTFDQVLPFDVPVRVCAEVPAGTTRASVKVAASGRRLGAIDVDPETCAIPRRAPMGLGTSGFPPAPRCAGSSTAAAERYYVFCFELEKQATDAEVGLHPGGAGDPRRRAGGGHHGHAHRRADPGDLPGPAGAAAQRHRHQQRPHPRHHLRLHA